MISKMMEQEIVQKILNKIEPKKIILFGSYACGSPNENSDLDLLIVEEKVDSKIKEKMKIKKILDSISIPKDILVISKEEFDFYKNEFGSVIKEVYERGVELWSS